MADVSPPLPPLPDASAREAILTDLNGNLVVEAAAGTGKTTALVGRLINLFRRGALSGDARLAAVTFTTKAASELRERLETRLAGLLLDPDLDPAERASLEAAAAALPECHIGTIHSFCARLIRERPVEAGVGPDFRELEQDDDALLVRQAWDTFCARLLAGAFPNIREVLETHDLDLESLYAGFTRFAEFPDIDVWPGETCEAVCDQEAFLDAVRRYNHDLERLRPRLDDCDSGGDPLIDLWKRLQRRCRRLPAVANYAECYRLAKLFKEKCKAKVTMWEESLGLKKDEVKDEQAAYDRFYADHVNPFMAGCRATVYAAAMRSFRAAGEIYDALRRERRVLNFQDLLLAAARLLRTHPAARADLARRYAVLLVDEVQDADPVQAEIMFLLAADSAHPESDWRRCQLRPGALFMVGDPKQSIYRFRRADIEVYQEMRSMVTAQGGKALGLTANFRSHPEVIDWVNRIYGPAAVDLAKEAQEMALSGRFPKKESPYNPGYIPLECGRPAPVEPGFSGVYYMETIPESRKAGINADEVRQNEAHRIATFIRHAVDTGLAIADKDVVRPARPGDFMIVPPKTKMVPLYAEAVRRLGLPCQATGGAPLATSPALGLLSVYLRALAQPDDGVRLLAALRSGLFGLADTALYEWKRAGGVFDFRTAPPEAILADAPAATVAGTMALMCRHADLFHGRHPLAALDAVVEELGLREYASLGEDASQALGAVAEALALLRREGPSLASLGDVSQRLDELRSAYDKDPLPALGDDPDAVRVMNLHKTKGLEAPMVFLTTTARQQKHPAKFSVRRRDGRATAAMAIMDGEYGNVRLVEPLEWEAMAEEEEYFLAAERTRLHYVAATRAGSALVVSVHSSKGQWKSDYLPHFIPGETIANPLPEPDASVAARPSMAEPLVPPPGRAAVEAVRAEHRQAMHAPSYHTEQAKPDGVAPLRAVSDLAPDVALRLGEAVHTLLAAPSETDIAGRVGVLLGEFTLSPDLVDDIVAMVRTVRASALWARAEASARCFREAPFTTVVEKDGLPTLRHGVIDLVFREGGGWVVVDYKSDTLAPDADPAVEARRHQAQLAAYARAWEAVAGEPVTETGIFYLRSGLYQVVKTAGAEPSDR